MSRCINRPFAQLLSGLERGNRWRSVSHLQMVSVFPKSRKRFFLSPFWTVLSPIHIQVTDRPSPDAPSLTQAIIVQLVYWKSFFGYTNLLFLTKKVKILGKPWRSDKVTVVQAFEVIQFCQNFLPGKRRSKTVQTRVLTTLYYMRSYKPDWPVQRLSLVIANLRVQATGARSFFCQYIFYKDGQIANRS